MLELIELSKSFGETRALNNVTFDVTPGTITGFLGRNGAGKSTTMRSIFGLVGLDSGTILWNGAPVTQKVRMRFGFMPEQRGLYRKMKIVDQVAYFARLKGVPKAQAKRDAAQVLEGLGLGDRLTDTLESLSHGNQQRVQLAAATTHAQDLCVLDEPFNGLDPAAVQSLIAALKAKAQQGCSVLFSSHQLDLVEDVCDSVVILEAGSVRVRGQNMEVRYGLGYKILNVCFGEAVDPKLVNALAVAAPKESSSESLGKSLGETSTQFRIKVRANSEFSELASSCSAIGSVTSFSLQSPSLAEVFASAVK